MNEILPGNAYETISSPHPQVTYWLVLGISGDLVMCAGLNKEGEVIEVAKHRVEEFTGLKPAKKFSVLFF